MFSFLISTRKKNYVKNFTGVYEGMSRLECLLATKDLELHTYFRRHSIDVTHFAFRWVYCLLLREFPVFLTVCILDHYFLEGEAIEHPSIWLALALLLKFSKELQKKTKDEAMIFLHRLPTENWGFRDVESLVREKNELALLPDK